MNPSYIYLLHFHSPLGEHAEHYAGCTSNLRRRLADHAAGHGSEITRACHKRGIQWTLAQLAVVPHAQMRRLERSLKDHHNGPRYCPICSDPFPALPFPESVPYCLETLRMPIDSAGYTIAPTLKTNAIEIRDLTKLEDPSAMRAIQGIYAAERDTLGWIPIGGTGGLDRLKAEGGLTILSVGSDVAGYAAWSLSKDKSRLNVHQCAIREDQRLRQYGRCLVSALAARHPTASLIAKVRDDLAANHFWQQIGFERKRTATHRTSGSTIHHYYAAPKIGVPQ